MFEGAIVRAGSLRGVSLPVAVALHGLAFGAILGSSVWFVEEPSEPPVPVTFPQISGAGTPGTPAGPEGSRGIPRTAAAPVRLAREVIAPVPPMPSGRDVGLAPVSSIGNGPDDGSALVGFAGDGRGGTPGSGVDPEAGRLTDDIVRPGGEVRAPEILRRVEPQYPEAARKARIEGTVILDAVIAATGKVEEVRVIRSAGKLLDDAAAEALRRWTYRPATLNGRSVRVLLTVTVDFRVH
jgi:protein TonB